MITIGHFRGEDKEIEKKTGLSHSAKFYNGALIPAIEKILKTGFNVMITQKKSDKPPYKEYTIWIDKKNFK